MLGLLQEKAWHATITGSKGFEFNKSQYRNIYIEKKTRVGQGLKNYIQEGEESNRKKYY